MFTPRSGLLMLLVLALALSSAFLGRGDAQTTNRAFPKTATALSSTKILVNGSGAVIDFLHCDNPSNAEAFLQLFNAALANVTVGTTVPTLTFGIPVSSAAGQLTLTGSNLWFSTAITVAATTTATGSSAPSAAINCNFGLR